MTWFSVRQPALLLFALLLAACGDDTRGDLDSDSQLAFEIGVVSTLASPSAMFPVSVSEALMKRVQGTKGIHREVSAFGMMGAGRIISDGGGKVLISKISGPVNASVEVRNGEIGLKEGEIYVGEGTLLMNAEGTKFSFIDGKWVLTN